MTAHTATLTLTPRHVNQLRDHLLREDAMERVLYAYCSCSADRVLVEELVPVTDDQLDTQTTTTCRPALAVERELLQECHDRGMYPLIVHSHPFDDTPAFSTLDEDLMAGLQSMITDLWPETTVMFAVIGTSGITAAVSTLDAAQLEPLPVTVPGNWTLDPPLETPPAETTPASDVCQHRYDRTIRAITEDGQRQLAATHIGIVGCGGLGSIMAEEFARYGVQHLTIVDPKVVKESNLPRLFGAYDHHTGRPKVEVMKEHLWKVNPAIEVTAVQDMAENAAETLKQVALIVAGLDRVSTRMWLNQFAVRHLIPYVDAGVVIETADTSGTDTQTADEHEGVDPDHDESAASEANCGGAETGGHVASMEGHIQCIVPGANACFDCLDRADPEAARIERLSDDELNEELARGYIDETELSPEPAVVPLNGIIASKTVQLVAKYVTGYAAPAGYLRFEGLGNTLTELNTMPHEGCPTCGPTGILGRGDRVPPETGIGVTTTGPDQYPNLDLDTDLNLSADTLDRDDADGGDLWDEY